MSLVYVQDHTATAAATGLESHRPLANKVWDPKLSSAYSLEQTAPV